MDLQARRDPAGDTPKAAAALDRGLTWQPDGASITPEAMMSTEREQLFHEAIMGAARPLAKLVALELAELVSERRGADPVQLGREANVRVQGVLGDVIARLRATVNEFLEQGLSAENVARLIGQYGGHRIPQA